VRSVLVFVAMLAALPAAFAIADEPPAERAAASTAPHLDAVEQALRGVSPGLEGSVWQRTSGNSLDAQPGWLLQTPGCWGDATCADRPGTQRLLATITANISQATRTVDISTLAPFPDGAFQDAIVAGLKAATAKGHKLRARIMVGAVPIGNLNVVPASYRNQLNSRLGAAAASVTLNIASMTTAKTAFSWNHSKILAVDGETAIVGGVNFWKAAYLDANPVSDVAFTLRGPAAGSAGRYLDTLWTWTCQNKWNPAYVWFASSNGAACLGTLHRDANPNPAPPAGNVPVIAVGSLGVGIKKVDPTSSYRPTLPTARDARCFGTLHDYTNANRDYDTVNPEESALRALIGSADRQVVISQQDVSGNCPPLAKYDVRLYDILAAKLAAGVKVRIVLSDPANLGTFGSGYSLIKSLAEISDLLRNRLALATGDQQRARAAMCQNLQLASFRHAAAKTWADGTPYAAHHKLVSVDDAAFYLGSKNLYPSWLQDFGYIVENRTAAAQLKADLLDREWQYSNPTATVDYARGLCPA
jgi:phosphatidylserine/phosphatidylglycerophosphate/cardiolipin synthase-like enzyme